MMPAISRTEAVERLAMAVEKAPPDMLVEIYIEMFPAKSKPACVPLAQELAQHVRTGFAPESIVDLWRVLFPGYRNMYYDEEDDALKYNEREPRYAEQ
jgi:hypothetical protein